MLCHNRLGLFVLLLLLLCSGHQAQLLHTTSIIMLSTTIYSHQAIVVSTAVREWSSPSVTVRGSAGISPDLKEAYSYSENGRQGKEFPLLFHCMYVVGALCTRRCLHHHHTPLATTREFSFYHSSWRTVGPAPDGPALTKQNLIKAGIAFLSAEVLVSSG